MDRGKSLVKNTAILAVGKLSSKFFTFLLLPLYTSVLLPDDFGTVDVIQTVISLILYFLTMQVEAAIFRFLIECRDREEDTRQYIATAVGILIANSLLFTLAIMLVNLFVSVPHLLLFILSMLAQGYSFLMLNIARGKGRNTLYSLSSFVITVVSLLVNLLLILGLGFGASSILAAVAVSNFVGGTVILFRNRVWQCFRIRYFSVEKLREMLRYSVPLIPNAISWWIANISDRILILFFLGSVVNGIYAAANKIPTIYTTVFSVFNLAWSESVSLAVKDADCSEYVSNMMERSRKVLSFLALGIISCMSIFFGLLIGPKYSDAYDHVYILLVAIFINSMCSLYGGILTGFKDSATIGKTTVYGAVVNLLINLLLIKVIGLYAASVSTLISYAVIFVMRSLAVRKFVTVVYVKKSIASEVLALAVVSAAYFSGSLLIKWGVLGALIVWGCISNRELLLDSVAAIKKKLGY